MALGIEYNAADGSGGSVLRAQRDGKDQDCDGDSNPGKAEQSGGHGSHLEWNGPGRKGKQESCGTAAGGRDVSERTSACAGRTEVGEGVTRKRGAVRGQFFTTWDTEGHGACAGLGARAVFIAVPDYGGAMKIGVEDRRKVALAAGLLLVAAVLFGRRVTAGSPSSGTAGGAHAIEKSVLRSDQQAVDPTLRVGTLRDTETMSYLGNGRDIFRVVEERQEVEAGPREETKVTGSPNVAVVAPIPLSFFGFSRKSGVSTVFLLKGEDVFLAKEGDIVDRRYKILRVTTDAVEVEDLLSERNERLVLRRG